jgi:hypothetical protein
VVEFRYYFLHLNRVDLLCLHGILT